MVLPKSLEVDAEAAFHTLLLVKKLIFNTSETQTKFLDEMGVDSMEAALSKLLVEEEDNKNLQNYFAPYLRSAAIEHLRSGQTEFAKNFRKKYEEIHNDSRIMVGLDYFLETQGKNKSFSSVVEAAALGDLFNVNVLMTPLVRGAEQTTVILNKSKDKSAPIIELYNVTGNNWYLEPPKVPLSNGNSLYNAFALALRQSAVFQDIVKNVLKKKIPVISAKDKTKFKKQIELKKKIQDLKTLSLEKMLERVIRFKFKLFKPRAKKDLGLIKGLDEKDFPQYTPFMPERWYDPEGHQFLIELLAFQDKAAELRNKSVEQPSYHAAAVAAHSLVISLNQAANTYFNSEARMTPKDFISFCTDKINKARPVLEKHRGWTQVLGNLALAIVSVGVSYLVAGIINKGISKGLLFFKTESAEKLDLLQRAVDTHNKPKQFR